MTTPSEQNTATAIDIVARKMVNFWLEPFRSRGWDERLELLEEIDHEIRSQCGTEDAYHRLSERFTSLLIDRLGAEPIRSRAQAYGYLNSSSALYRQSAFAWLILNGTDTMAPPTAPPTAPPPPVAPGTDKRTAVRHSVDLTGVISVNDNEFDGKLVDISKTGAKVATLGQIPQGTRVSVQVPTLGRINAVVVWASATFIGLMFVSPQAGAIVGAG